MSHPFEQRLAEAWPPADWSDVTVLAAVSGGSDSVALLRALAALAGYPRSVPRPGCLEWLDMPTGGHGVPVGRLCVAHLNHQLRPEADEDERFVVDLCRRLGISCEVERIAVARLAEQMGDGLEAAARKARYQFFERTAGRIGARFVALAHTADDQAETILHRIIRGTGLRGLSGMARARPLGHITLIRPLLGIRRSEIRAYLESLGQDFRHDSSNDDRRYTRNRIRHELLPRLCRRFNPRAIEALLRLGTLAGEAQAVVDDRIDEWLQGRAAVDAGNAVCIDLTDLPDRSSYLVRELLMAVWRRQGWPMQSMGRTQWDALFEMAILEKPPLRRTFPGGTTAEVSDGRLRLTR